MDFINVSLKTGLALAASKHALLIDVREPDRYQEGHLPEAVNMPNGRFHENLLNYNEKIILYCDFGGRSMLAARRLAAKGYQVYNIVGGVYYCREELTVD